MLLQLHFMENVLFINKSVMIRSIFENDYEENGLAAETREREEEGGAMKALTGKVQ